MIEIRKSPIHGFGVFAKQRIEKGQVVEVSPFIFFDGDKDQMFGQGNDYLFYYSPLRSVLVLLHGSIFNHSDKPNVDYGRFDKKTMTVTFFASETIEADQECFISYGKTYWKSRK